MAYDALGAFYVANTYLPWASGICASVAATKQVLPWRTLGLQEELSYDGWRQRLSYHVSAPLTTAGAAASGDLAVRDDAESAPGSAELTAAAAFVVASHRENWLGAWLPSGQRKTTSGIPTQEAENSHGAAPFVDKALSQVSGDEFDDLVIWRETGALAQTAGMVFSGAICSAADNLWSAYSCSGGSSADECVAAGAIRSRCS